MDTDDVTKVLIGPERRRIRTFLVGSIRPLTVQTHVKASTKMVWLPMLYSRLSLITASSSLEGTMWVLCTRPPSFARVSPFLGLALRCTLMLPAASVESLWPTMLRLSLSQPRRQVFVNYCYSSKLQ